MRLRCVDRRPESGLRLADSLQDVLVELCRPAGCENWPVDLVLIEDGMMQELNLRYRRRGEVTDVLSFSYLSTGGTGAPQLAAGVGYAACDLWWDQVEREADTPIGEILMAPAYIARSCRERGWSHDHEWALLTAHGMLHLLGWIHDDPASEAAMREQEADLLRRVNLGHPILERGTTD